MPNAVHNVAILIYGPHSIMNWIRKVFRRGKSEQAAAAPPDHPQASSDADDVRHVTFVSADNPISDAAEDTLGREGGARSFARAVLRMDRRGGLVVGVMGAWGSGKTSFVNLARPSFEAEGVAVLDFNPWMFSGAEQLVQSFFSELSAQIRLRPGFAEVGKALEEYGELFSNLTWVPLIGPWIERGQEVAKSIAGLMQRKHEGVHEQRAKIDKALSSLKQPILVVIDDIDRLSTSEIRDIFRLVRLTASFTNVIYLLAFDRARVEDALSEQGIPGRAYLEKIVQYGFDLPVVPEGVLNRQVFTAISSALEDVEDAGALDQSVWADLFFEVVRPLIGTMRDVRRYASGVAGTVRDLRGQVALADVLALESVRIFLPDVFRLLPNSIEALTTTSDVGLGRGDRPHLRTQIELLLQTAGDNAGVVRSLLQRLFMAAQRHVGGSHYGSDWSRRWLRERRVAHAENLRLYLERVAGEGLIAFNLAEHAWSLMPDADAFEAFLRTVPRERVVDAISSLEAYEDEVTPERVLPGVVVLLNMLPRLPNEERGFFSLGTDMIVGRVVYRLVRSQNCEAFVEHTVREALPRINTLQAKLTLIQMIGHRENVGHRLVPEPISRELEAAWRDEVRAATLDSLLSEPQPLWTLLTTRREADAGEPQFVVPRDSRLFYQLLLNAYGESKSQTMGNRAVTRPAHLAWDALVQLLGSEDEARAQLETLRAHPPDGSEHVLALAERYLTGWRPRDFGRD